MKCIKQTNKSESCESPTQLEFELKSRTVSFTVARFVNNTSLECLRFTLSVDVH